MGQRELKWSIQSTTTSTRRGGCPDLCQPSSPPSGTHTTPATVGVGTVNTKIEPGEGSEGNKGCWHTPRHDQDPESFRREVSLLHTRMTGRVKGDTVTTRAGAPGGGVTPYGKRETSGRETRGSPRGPLGRLNGERLPDKSQESKNRRP